MINVVGYVACFGYVGISLLFSIRSLVPASPELVAARGEDYFDPLLGVVFLAIGLVMYWCGDVLLRRVHQFKRPALVRSGYVAGSLIVAAWVLTVMGPEPRVVTVNTLKSSEVKLSGEVKVVTNTNR